MRVSALTLAIACFIAPLPLTAATPDVPLDAVSETKAADTWIINGGTFKLRLNMERLSGQGLEVTLSDNSAATSLGFQDFLRFPVDPSDGLEFAVSNGAIRHFTGGKVFAYGGFKVQSAAGETFNYSRFELRADPENPQRLQMIGADGTPWFYVNHMMFKLTDDYYNFYMRSADLNATAAFAERVGAPTLADAYIGEVQFNIPVVQRPRGFSAPQAPLGGPDFHGTNGFLADVLLSDFTMQFSRCRRSTGANGCQGGVGDNGEVVFTPSSTRRNTNNANTADVPWYEKFTVSPYAYPYPGNDQHPYLIWNIYRVTDGQLEQIGASGIKHAFLTVNSGCASPFGLHILSRNCGDTYGVGNNDAWRDLGPRSEVVPSTGRFGRCFSIFDTNCDGNEDNPSSSGYRDRLIVRESQMLVPNSQFYSESWYVIQDDINIYNTMGHQTMAPNFTGNAWAVGTQGAFVPGPVLDTWVDPTANPTHNVRLDTRDGHAKIAVKVKTLASCPGGSGLSGTCYRYDYAVNNFDLTHAVLNTSPPADSGANLQVMSNLGILSFSIPRGSDQAVFLEASDFADIDIDAGNDWNGVAGAQNVTWTSVAGNELNWGELFRFSLVTNAAPNSNFVGEVTLGMPGGAGQPTSYAVNIMIPNTYDLFSDSMED